jgi:hypothetical protein
MATQQTNQSAYSKELFGLLTRVHLASVKVSSAFSGFFNSRIYHLPWYHPTMLSVCERTKLQQQRNDHKDHDEATNKATMTQV